MVQAKGGRMADARQPPSRVPGSPRQVCAADVAASFTFAMSFASAAVSTCAIVELADSPGRVATFRAYSVNSYRCELPPGHGPKNCWLVPDPPMPFCLAPLTFGTLNPLPRPSGSEVVAAGMSQMAQCLLPLAVSTRTIASLFGAF